MKVNERYYYSDNNLNSGNYGFKCILEVTKHISLTFMHVNIIQILTKNYKGCLECKEYRGWSGSYGSWELLPNQEKPI
jgi:hypothetical protein